ncbi:hypothetical protein OR1_02680 [Geobacter sp. OR-1]|uniref:DUF2786 domain-containing protein n=1 Tax=Geobacter sp. OR-1 TaxID=1266765 RepID=UPI000543C293|nr:DUF2786 domain-containing protein [Geobacter sp. OR-1]GAM10391.1 hypothetical protein OR1_02680 [Geobacter sp. OR-1]
MSIENPVIEKIRKLLALANSSNEHEAALAASHAQRLLSEHNLAMADIESEQKPQSADKVEAQVSKTLPKWVRNLSAGVCTAFDCQAVHHPATGRMTFIGVGADVQVAAYTFSYLDKTLRRLCSSFMKINSSDRHTNRHRELMRQSYYLGAVSTITGRLREQKIQTPITPGALVPIKEGLIKKAMSDMGPMRTFHGRRSYIDSHAYSQGQQDGQAVGINKGISGNCSPQQKRIQHCGI